MKIAYFTDTFLPQVNGIATALANQAAQLGKQGHSVLIFTPKLDGIPREKFKAENVQVIHLPTVPALLYPEFKLGVFGLPKVIKYLAKFDPDIIHLHSPLTVGMDAVTAAKIFKKPLVGTIHVYLTDSSYLRWLKYRLAVKVVDKVVERYLNFLFSQCDLVLAPSKMLVKELTQTGFKKTVHYLPNGVILSQYKSLSLQDQKSIKKKYGLKDKIVLHFGRLSPEKNVDLLIKSFSLLAKKHPDVSLLIIGDGPAKKSLVKLTKRLKLDNQVVFTGFIDHQKLISSGILTLGNLFATASTMENNPMAVLEAEMHGLPIVGVKQAGLVELISSNGFLAEAGDIKEMAEKMEKILYNQTLADSMQKKSLEAIKPYAIDKVADTLLGFYHKLKLETDQT
ncbi:glycosyltransferase [Candidatus Daviesbacteria bacterium]|nr:glycosyltransferase [Candidatus Daviesbacteria bacterium]